MAVKSAVPTARSIPAQQPRIEVDVWNLGSVSELTIFRPLAFIEILLNLAVCTKSFSVSPRPVNPTFPSESSIANTGIELLCDLLYAVSLLRGFIAG